MSFIENTAFEPKVTNNRFDDLCNVAGEFYAESAPADCSAGILVSPVELLDAEGFAGLKNLNTWQMEAVAEAGADPIYACNTHDSQTINGYHVGHQTLGLGIPAGEIGNYTKIDFSGDAIYRFGVGNFTTAVGENGFATISNGQLVPAAAAPESGVYFKILATGTFREGASDAFGYVDVQACHV